MPEPLTIWVQTATGVQELPATDSGGGGDVDAHITDTVDAHDASAVSFVPTGTIAATNVQDAIAEVAGEAAGAAVSEVEIGASDPIGTNAAAELWYDTDAPAPAGGGTTMRYIAGTGAGDYATSTTTLIDLGALSVSIPAAVGDRLYLQWSGEVFSATNTNIGGSFNVGPTTGDVRGVNSCRVSIASTVDVVFFCDWVYTVVAGDIVSGSVTVKARWRSLSSTITIRNGVHGVPLLIVRNYGAA